MKQIEPRAILFRVGGLGDLLVALPAIALVRRSLPGHRLTLVGRAEYALLFGRSGIVDEAQSFDDPVMAAIFAGEGTPAPGRDNEHGHLMGRRKVGKGTDPKCDPRPRPEREPLTDWTRGVALAVGWSNRRIDWPADEWWSRRGITRTCFVTYNGSSGQPMSRFFIDRTADFFNARPSEELFDDCARLGLPSVLTKGALAALNLRELAPGEKRLVVHPGSGGRAKRWPLPNFLEVVRRAAALGVAGVLVTGEAEEDLEPSLRDVTLPQGWSRFSRLPTDTLAGLLASSTHYIGNDSGPTHLAAACGVRVLAFFRDENLPAWRPFGRSHVLSAPSPDRIPLAVVLPAVDGFLAS